MSTHLASTPPAVTAEELAAACWADDGGPVWEPPPDQHTADWLRISAALTARLPEIAGRDDVIVTCRSATRSGSPAAFFPTTAELELHTGCFTPMRPPAINPHLAGDEEYYPAAWGAFIHEGAHAAHSRWFPPHHLCGTAMHQAAEVLEESRAEAALLARRPQDRRFLRACIRTLVKGEVTQHDPDTPWQAAYVAGLLLARRDTGVLDPDETQAVEDLVTDILGEELLATLADIWTAAQATADTDGTAMLAYGQAWCQALGVAAQGAPPISPGGSGGRLAEAVAQAVDQVVAHEADEAAARTAAAAASATRAEQQATQAAHRQRAAKTAQQVFNPHQQPRRTGRGRRRRSPILGTRPPTTAEKSAAGQLARALKAAAHRERTITTQASAAPPGRLHMGAALARDAQRSAGALPTARPWITTRRRHTPAPPLRVGIAVDVSGSMDTATAPIASAAWILAKATALTGPDSATATVAFDQALTAITHPGRAPAKVTDFDANGGAHNLAEATDALTSALALDTPGTARLLVIASDGRYWPDERARAATRIHTLNQAGCAVLWLAFEPDPEPLPGTTFLVLPNPARAVAAIARAATTALAASR